MAFIEPNNLVYGISELPARLYGGLVYSYERIKQQPSAEKVSFIPLQNTAMFRKRDLLFPHPSTCAVPIFRLKARDNQTRLNRLVRTPADIYLTPEYAISEQNRNLLAGETTSDNSVRLWCVDDNSDRTALQELNFNFDIPVDPHLPIRIKREENLQEEEPKFVLESAALELRSFNRDSQSNKVLIRRETGLDLYNSETQELSSVYKWPLKYFERIAYMDEIAVVNKEGLVFYGTIGSDEFTRVKSEDKIISVVTTDSPANLLLASKSTVFQADIRVQSSELQTVFNFNKDEWHVVDPLSEYAYQHVRDKERVWHVNCVRPNTETYFITSTQRIYVIDRRMPMLPLFYTNHFNFNGGEYCMTGEPFVHDELEMEVYQYFSLSRILNTGISHWSIGWNKREAVWTSMGPKCQIEAPNHVVDWSVSHLHLPHLSDEIKKSFPEVTRAIHYQQFPQNVRPGENRGLLFRLMDNGQIWFDSINFAKPKAYCSHEGIEKEPEQMRQSIDEIIEFLGNPPEPDSFENSIDEKMMIPTKSKLKGIDYNKMLDNLTTKMSKWQPIVEEDKLTIEVDNIDNLLHPSSDYKYDELKMPANAPESERHKYSEIVINMTNKAKTWMEEDEHKYVQENNEEVEE